MTNTTTLRELKDRTLDYADLTGSQFVDEDRLVDYINTALSELQDLVVNAYPEDYFRKETTFTLVSGTEEYSLPTDFYKAIAVYYISSNRRFKVERWQPHEIDGYRNAPISGGTVEMWYVPEITKLSSDSDQISLPIPIGWEDYIAWSAAIRLLVREESDTSQARAERDRQEARIITMLSPRDTFTPDSVGDYYGRWEDTRHLLRFDERYFKYRIMDTSIFFIEIEYLGI